MERVRCILWEGDCVKILDQLKLPEEEIWVECTDYDCVAKAIKNMNIRGAPAIGVAAAFALALFARKRKGMAMPALREEFEKACQVLRATRPTAVNLFWAIERMKRTFYEAPEDPSAKAEALEKEAIKIHDEDVEMCKKMGENGEKLIPDGAKILTHCNTGALATAGYGTALGVVREAFYRGKKVFVWVDETRPYLQGARLTAWELAKEKIPHRLITDNTAGFLMQLGKVDLVILGADRIAKNGDTANKIGTYSLAVLAKHHGIPFYVVAPSSSFDLSIPSGKHIPIEERSPDEVVFIKGRRIAPKETDALHLAFDVTPAELITAIVTEKGVIYPPFEENIPRVIGGDGK